MSCITMSYTKHTSKKGTNSPSPTSNWKATTITEFGKESIKTYCLENLLRDWDGVENVSLTLKVDDELPEDEIQED